MFLAQNLPSNALCMRASVALGLVCRWSVNATSMDATERFAAEAVRFRDWARDGKDSGELATRNALIRITALYFAALELPPEWSEELTDQPDAKGIANDERWAVYHGIAARLPFTDYARVFEPLTLPPEKPVVGSVGDDVADIYSDVVSGPVEYEAGRNAQVMWKWGFHLRSHWGQHATDAISALHHWLADNAWDQFHRQA